MYRVFTNFNVTSVIGVVSERCGNMDDGEEIRLIIILSATFYCCFALWEGRGLIDYLNFFLTACNHGCYKGRGDGWIICADNYGCSHLFISFYYYNDVFNF